MEGVSGQRRVGRPNRAAVHDRLAALVEEVRQRYGGLPLPAEARGIWKDIWHHEVHHSTAIEGNTLVLRQVEEMLERGRAVGNKELREYLEVRGYAEAAAWVYSQGVRRTAFPGPDLVTVTEVRRVHEMAMHRVWVESPHPHATSDEAPGGWRRHNIEPFPGGMRPPDFAELPALLADWVADVCRIPHDPAPLAEAVAARHAAFERIHPFLDGNGRTARLLTNLVLARSGYPPVIVRKRERTAYLRALQRADEGDTGPLGELFARAITDNLMRFVIPAIAGPLRLVPLDALTSSDASAAALAMAAHRGRLQAERQPDGAWRSTRQWVDEYLRTRSPRGRRGRASSEASTE